jgi:hypothetical protein
LVGLVLLFKRKDLKIEKYLLLFWWLLPTLYLIQPHLLVISMPSYRVLNYLYYPIIFLAAYAIGSILPLIKKKLVTIITMLLVSLLILNYPVFTENFSFSDHKAEKMNEEAFLYLNKIILPGENVFTEHVKSKIADQSIKNYLPFNNTVYFRTFWFRYEQGEDISTWNMMESPEKYLDMYRQKNIAYVVLENNPEKYPQFKNQQLFKTIFENEIVIIYRIDYSQEYSFKG